VLCPKAFDLPSKQARSTHFLGAFVDEERKDDIEFPWDQLDGVKPLVYYSLGTQSRLFSMRHRLLESVIDALCGGMDLQLVLSVGEDMSAGSLRRVPANAIVVHKAPQLQVLKKASLVLTHGGINTVKESIVAGVPLIAFCLPTNADILYPNTALRIVYHGLGLMADIESVSGRQISQMVDRILGNGSYRAQTLKMKEKFLAADRSAATLQTLDALPQLACVKV
jgi:MGT family glycosyltransferase